MPLAPIEVQWGGGKWPNAPKRRLRPYVRTALELAQLGLEECCGISGKLPETATVWCVEQSETIAGLTDVERPNDIELYVGYEYIKRPRKLPRVVAPLVTAAAHEMAHVYRLQSGHDFDLLEHAAAEGISMHVEQVLAAELGFKQVAEYDLDRVLALDTNKIESIRADLFAANVGLVEVERADPDSGTLTEIHDIWFDCDRVGSGLPDGYIIGMHGVQQQLTLGASLADIINMTAPEILGVGL